MSSSLVHMSGASNQQHIFSLSHTHTHTHTHTQERERARMKTLHCPSSMGHSAVENTWGHKPHRIAVIYPPSPAKFNSQCACLMWAINLDLASPIAEKSQDSER